ncbi:MAG: hypothetical protein ACPL28_11820, partial [bacterium]
DACAVFDFIGVGNASYIYVKVLEFEKFQYLIMKSFIIEKNEHKIFRGSGMKLGNGDISRIVGQRGFSGGIPLNILIVGAVSNRDFVSRGSNKCLIYGKN